MAVLHRHALESVLSFASVRELAQLLSVCHDFNGAVRSMAPIAGEVRRDLSSVALAAAMHSLLARHITVLGERGSMGIRLGPEELALLATRAPDLRVFTCWPNLFDAAAFAETRWPAQLSNLTVFVVLPRRGHHDDAESVARTAERVNALLSSLAQLTQLERLSLVALPTSYVLPAAINFAPLAFLTRLQYFYCNFPFTSANDPAFTAGAAAQAEQLKALTSLRELRLFGERAMMAMLLRRITGSWRN